MTKNKPMITCLRDFWYKLVATRKEFDKKMSIKIEQVLYRRSLYMCHKYIKKNYLPNMDKKLAFFEKSDRYCPVTIIDNKEEMKPTLTEFEAELEKTLNGPDFKKSLDEFENYGKK